MKAPKDYLGNDILVGDTLYVALLSGRSATMETRVVTEILPDGRLKVQAIPIPRWGHGRGILQFADKCIVDMSKRSTQ